MNRLTTIFRIILDWLEHGDLVPLIVTVSAIHYAVILREYDHLVAAVAIGTLVDLGHYRWTKAAVRYPGDNWREKWGRWTMVLIMSAIALNYQQRFYNDWWLSVPMPLLIASLAWLNQKDKVGTRQTGIQTAKKQKVQKQDAKFDKLDRANVAKAAKKQARLDELLAIYQNGNDLKPSEIAKQMSVTPQTVRNLTKELETAGLLNGKVSP